MAKHTSDARVVDGAVVGGQLPPRSVTDATPPADGAVHLIRLSRPDSHAVLHREPPSRAARRMAPYRGAESRAARFVAREARTASPGGRAHRVLAYAVGVLLVLSTSFGVVGTTSREGHAVASSASSRWDGAAAAAWKHTGVAWFLLFGFQLTVDMPIAGAPVGQAAEPPPPVAAAAPAEEPAEEEDAGTAPAPAPAPEPVQEPDTSTGTTLPAGTWLSGAAGEGVADGTMAEWRGTPFGIAGTWADNNEAMVELWQLRSDGEYGAWQESLDIAIGGISDDESWSEAADGAYDERWRESLSEARRLWGTRAGTLFIRFAHEMNGTWFPWSVEADEADDFISSWQRFRNLQQEIFPESQLVFCVNRDSSDNDLDWRTIFPGAEYVDVMGVDYYNMWPYVGTAQEWQESLTDTDHYGAPRGLQAHLDFARSVGLPLSVGEWSGNADEGDSVAYMQGMHDFFAANAGSGPGQLLYEVHFNVDKDGQRWVLYGDTRMPESAAAYRDLW